MAKIAIEELERYLWGSAELLRTSIDAGAYKQYIFPLLFLKRLSDVYDEENAHAEAEYGAEARDWDETHLFRIPQGARWSDVRNTTKNIGTALTKAFQAIEQANPRKLSGIFGDAAWTNKDRLPDRLLKDLIEHFSTLTLSLANCPEDELGTGYEYLIKKFADDSGHTAQEFYTNRTVVHLMTELLRPQPGESIYDPTCGSAGMLISCIQYLKDHHQEWRNIRAYGQEVNSLTSAIGRMNLFLHGVEDFHIANNDTLLHPAFVQEGKLQTFDLVLANPPYSISQWNREAFASDKYGRNFLGVPPQSRADYAFLQHILKSLDPQTGRCAILFPHGVLFRQEEKAMRAQLIESDLVEAVIGLGPNLFYNSPMEACILICRTRKEDARKGHVLFINAVDRVERKNAQSYLTDEHIKEIATAYEAGAAVENFARLVPIAEIQQNDDSMSIPLYVRNPNQGVTVEDDDHTLSEAYELWEQVSFHMHHCYTRLDENPCSDVTRKSNYGTHSAAFPSGEGGPRQRWKGSLVRQNKTHVQTSAGATTTVTLGDVATERKETYQPQGGPRYGVLGLDQMESGELSLHDWAKDDPANTFTKMFHAGDVLFGRRRAYLRKAVIAPYDGICSGDITVIRPNAKKILPALLPFVIQNDAFFDYAVGKSAGSLSPRAKWKDIQDYTFTLPPMEEQKQLATVLWSMVRTQEAYQRLLEKTEELVEARFREMFGDSIANGKNWDIQELGSLCKISRGGSPRPIEKFLGGTIPWIKIGDATDDDKFYLTSTREHIIEEGIKKSRLVKAGSLIFANCGVSLGFARIITFDGCIHDGWLALEDIDARLNKIFLLFSLNQMTAYFRRIAPYGTQPNLNINIMKAHKQILPPIELQNQFIDFIRQADQSKSALQHALAALQKTYRKLVSERLG